jgi:hypothetical protein
MVLTNINMLNAMKDSPLSFPLERDHPDLATAIRSQVGKILSHKLFSRSQRLSQLLRFTVEKSLSGEAHFLKEYTIGVDVFNRPDAFDPRLDSIVRVQISRLRRKLEAFYELSGHADTLVITMPPSGYTPCLTICNLATFAPTSARTIGTLDCRRKGGADTESTADGSIASLSRDLLEYAKSGVDFVVIRVDDTTDSSELLQVIKRAVSQSIGVALVFNLEFLERLWLSRTTLRTAWNDAPLNSGSLKVAS